MTYAHINVLDIKPNDSVLQFACFIFDASVPEIFMALGAGAKLCLVPQSIRLVGEHLLRYLKTEAITVATLTPSVLETLSIERLPRLRLLILAGEPAAEASVARWSQHCQVINAYGPTETTVCVSLEKVDLALRKLSIGKPIANTQFYILDQNANPVPIGVTGELYIGEAGLARGYLNRPALTKKRFIENPLVSEEDKHLARNLRLYRTGDLVRYLADGNIEYIGRIDHQVKLSGNKALFNV